MCGFDGFAVACGSNADGRQCSTALDPGPSAGIGAPAQRRGQAARRPPIGRGPQTRTWEAITTSTTVGHLRCRRPRSRSPLGSQAGNSSSTKPIHTRKAVNRGRRRSNTSRRRRTYRSSIIYVKSVAMYERATPPWATTRALYHMMAALMLVRGCMASRPGADQSVGLPLLER